jgi:hypothetical protein
VKVCGQPGGVVRLLHRNQLPPDPLRTKARLCASLRCFRSATSGKAAPMSIRKGPAWLPVASSAAKADAASTGPRWSEGGKHEVVGSRTKR